MSTSLGASGGEWRPPQRIFGGDFDNFVFLPTSLDAGAGGELDHCSWG